MFITFFNKNVVLEETIEEDYHWIWIIPKLNHYIQSMRLHIYLDICILPVHNLSEALKHYFLTNLDMCSSDEGESVVLEVKMLSWALHSNQNQ